MDFVNKLGLDWKLFGAQLVNFVILLFVLHRFLYKPIVKILDKRRKDIENNAAKTRALESRMQSSEEEVKKLIAEGESKAQLIIHASQEAANSLKSEILNQAQNDARMLLSEASLRIKKDQEEALRMVKQESEALIREGVFKVLQVIGEGEVSKALEKKAVNAISDLKSSNI